MDDKLRTKLERLKEKKGSEREAGLLALAEESQAPQVYNELGIYYKNDANDNEKAVEMFEKALAITEDASVYTNLASAYFNLAQKDSPERKAFMKKTVDAFQAAARLNSASYYFLGNLYMPKVNAPFPDDQEKAVSYFMKIEKNKGAIWAQAMKNVGLYYYHNKKDYIRASAYFYMVKTADPKDKKTANYYEYAFGKVNKRKFWVEQFKKMNDQNDVDRLIDAGKKKLEVRCPRCGSSKVSHISVWTNMKKTLSSSFGLRRFERYAVTWHCDSCGKEW